MKSVRSVYKIGHGPSSSHTVGPYNAALRFGQRHPDADHFRVTLYGSLAFTGAGHGTGKAILSGLPGAEIVVNTEEENLPHPDTCQTMNGIMAVVIRRMGIVLLSSDVIS